MYQLSFIYLTSLLLFWIWNVKLIKEIASLKSKIQLQVAMLVVPIEALQQLV